MNRTRAPLPRLLLLCLFSLLVLTAGAACGKSPTRTKWNLVWQDEFNGAAGQLPNPSRWAFDIGTDWGNRQLEYDTDRPENVSLDGAGNLVITAIEESYLGRNYTSGRINTRGRFEQNGGRFEARMRMPRGQGLWPAFWMLGSDFATVGWPSCGEIDILEYRGQEPNIVLGSLHGPGYSGANSLTARTTIPGAPLDSVFRVYAVEWTSSKITWFVDDHAYAEMGPGNLPPGTEWVFNRPFFIILNLAVGGNFVGPPDETTTFPQELVVDYVRVFRRK